MSRIRLVPVIFIAIISMAVLFAGWFAYQRFNLVNPLRADLMQVAGVQAVDVQTTNPSVVKIQLGPVKDLQTTYAQISRTVHNQMGNSQTVTLVDNKSDELNTAYENYLPVLLQGIAHGNYTDMISAVNQKATHDGITARVTMDQHNVYVQLMKGKNYLYDVIPFTLHQGGGAS